eukprot:947269_1
MHLHLQQLARHKITPLLLSTEINETSNVIYNAYQLFIITCIHQRAKDAINLKYHGLFSRPFRRRIRKMIAQKTKWKRDRFEMFQKYTDSNELMHERLNEFVY